MIFLDVRRSTCLFNVGRYAYRSRWCVYEICGLILGIPTRESSSVSASNNEVYLRFTYSTPAIPYVSSFFHRQIYEFAELGRIAWPLSSLFLLCRETIFGYRRSTPFRYSSYTRCDLPFGRNASGNKYVSRRKTWGELDNDRQCQRSRSALVERTTITSYYESFSNIDGFERKDNWTFRNYR